MRGTSGGGVSSSAIGGTTRSPSSEVGVNDRSGFYELVKRPMSGDIEGAHSSGGGFTTTSGQI